jgi:hypothetical protein
MASRKSSEANLVYENIERRKNTIKLKRKDTGLKNYQMQTFLLFFTAGIASQL